MHLFERVLVLWQHVCITTSSYMRQMTKYHYIYYTIIYHEYH